MCPPFGHVDEAKGVARSLCLKDPQQTELNAGMLTFNDVLSLNRNVSGVCSTLT